jgi:flagellar hook-length control protein FliK
MQGAQDVPGVRDTQGAQDVPGARDTQGAQDMQGARDTQNPYALADSHNVKDTRVFDVTPGAPQDVPHAVGAPSMPVVESAPVAQPTPAAQGLQNMIAAPAPQDAPDTLAAPVPQGSPVTPAAPAVPRNMRATSAAPPAPQDVPGMAVAPNAQAARFESGAELPKAAPAAPAVPQTNQPAAAAAAGSPDISTTQVRGYAQPRPAPLSANGAGTIVNASKAKVALRTTDAAPLRLERAATIAPRVMSPVPMMPHAAPAPVAAAVVSLPASSAGIADSQLGSQIVQSMRMQWAQGGGEATIELNPNFLGRVQVSVRVDRGVVSASVRADTTVVREWVAAHRDELSQTLAQQGLRLDKLEIAQAPKEQSARDGAHDPRHTDREASRHRRDDGTLDADTFDVQVPQELLDETPRSVEPR